LTQPEKEWAPAEETPSGISLEPLWNPSGRTRRWPYFFVGLAATVLTVASAVLMDYVSDPMFVLLMVGILLGVYISVINNIRRLHDLGHSGWWSIGFMLAGLIPLVGWLPGLWLLFCPGNKGENKWGT